MIKLATSPLYTNQSKSLQKKPCCEDPLCCDPEHYTVVFRNSYKSLGMSKEDFKDLMEEIDYDELEEVGAKAYLEEFNKFLPEELKISLTTLLAAVNIHKKQVGAA